MRRALQVLLLAFCALGVAASGALAAQPAQPTAAKKSTRKAAPPRPAAKKKPATKPKAKAKAAPARKAAAAPKAAKPASGARKIPRNHLSVRNVNTGERVTNLQLLAADPKNKKRLVITRNARKQMNRLLRDTRTKRHANAPDRLLWMIYQAAQHFDAQVTIISGLRQSARRTSRHFRSNAVDLRLEGIAPERVWAYCKRLKKVGCGFYPKSGFVHMDLRDKSYSWIEESDAGEAAAPAESVSQAAAPSE